jgi:hypothetical protein
MVTPGFMALSLVASQHYSVAISPDRKRIAYLTLSNSPVEHPPMSPFSN